jgi:hypothetical protein
VDRLWFHLHYFCIYSLQAYKAVNATARSRRTNHVEKKSVLKIFLSISLKYDICIHGFVAVIKNLMEKKFMCSVFVSSRVQTRSKYVKDTRRDYLVRQARQVSGRGLVWLVNESSPLVSRFLGSHGSETWNSYCLRILWPHCLHGVEARSVLG